MATVPTLQSDQHQSSGLLDQLMLTTQPSPDRSATDHYAPAFDEFPGCSLLSSPMISCHREAMEDSLVDHSTALYREDSNLKYAGSEHVKTPPSNTPSANVAEAVERLSLDKTRQPTSVCVHSPQYVRTVNATMSFGDSWSVDEPNRMLGVPPTPPSVKSENFYDSERDPRLSRPNTPVGSAKINTFSSPRNQYASRSMPYGVYASGLISKVDQSNTSDEFHKLSLEDEDEDEDTFSDSFDPRHIKIPTAPIFVASEQWRNNQLPGLLYRTWDERSGGYNSTDEFRPGVIIEEPPPDMSRWDPVLLEYAAKHFNRQNVPTPFISFSETFLVVWKKALEAISKSRDPFITVVNAKPAQRNFLYARPICRAVRHHGLADAKTRRYGASYEWFFWGVFQAKSYQDKPFLNTVRAADLLAMANEHAGIGTVLRVKTLLEGRSITTTLKTILKDPIVCNEDIASALATIARMCGFDASSKHDLLRQFVSDLARGGAIQPCPSESKDAVAASFMRTLTQYDCLCTLFSNGVKQGYRQLVDWARASDQLKEEARQHAVANEHDIFVEKTPFEDQSYRPSRGRRRTEEQSTPRLTRAASSALKKKEIPRHRSSSRGAYHPERLVSSRSLSRQGGKREREDGKDNGAQKRRKLVAVEI